MTSCPKSWLGHDWERLTDIRKCRKCGRVELRILALENVGIIDPWPMLVFKRWEKGTEEDWLEAIKK